MANSDNEEENNNQRISTLHHQMIPSDLTQDEFNELSQSIAEFHTYQLGTGRCSSLLAQRINAPPDTVWSVVRRFDKPQIYKHFIKSCHVDENFEMRVGCTRDVTVISGLPANTSRERLDILDDARKVTGFSITGGEHRLRNYKSVTTVHRFEKEEGIWTVVLESYVVDVPEGNSEEDTRLFADTVIRLNLQKLASITEAMNRSSSSGGGYGGRNTSSQQNGALFDIIYPNDKTFSSLILSHIVTHDGEKFPCWSLPDLSTFKEKFGSDTYENQLDVIGIDEAQFFGDLYEFCREAADKDGKTVFVAGLDGDFMRRRFGSVLDLIPIADTVTNLTSRCEVYGKRASFTMRKTEEKETELIGGAEKYMPVCRVHYVCGQSVLETARTVLVDSSSSSNISHDVVTSSL